MQEVIESLMIASPVQTSHVTPVTASGLPGRPAGQLSGGRDSGELGADAFDQLFDSVPLLGIGDISRQQLRRGGAGFGGVENGKDSRAARLEVLRSDDVSQRTNSSPRIAGAQIPHSEIAAERAAASSARQAQAEPGGQGNPNPASTESSSAARTKGRFNGAPIGSQPTNDTAQSTTTVPANSRTRGGSMNQPAVADRVVAARPLPRTGPPASTAPVRSPAARSPASASPLSKPQDNGAGLRGSGRGQPRPFSQPTNDAGALARIRQVDTKTGDTSAARGPHRFGRTIKSSSSQQTAFDRIAKVIQAGGNGRPAVVRIALDPPSLGHVQVHLRLSDDSIQVRLAAESPEARQVLMSQIDDLKSALEQHGVKVQRMEVVLLQGEGDELKDDRSSERFEDAASPGESGGRRDYGQPTTAEYGTERTTVADPGAGDDSGTLTFRDDGLVLTGSPGEVRLDVRA